MKTNYNDNGNGDCHDNGNDNYTNKNGINTYNKTDTEQLTKFNRGYFS